MAAASSKGTASQDSGSRIFLSRLPVDVGEKEVEELFKVTVGPLKESFLVYNSQGRSKGMAVVWFQRPGDALVARAKYHGKIVDGRRPIKIEILLDDNPAPKPPQTLLNRLAPAAPVRQTQGIRVPPAEVSTSTLPRPLKATPQTTSAQAKPTPIPPRRLRQKKGPKRLKKREQKTVADLDKEMDEYRASAPDDYPGFL
jgi:THO complex subunit 4